MSTKHALRQLEKITGGKLTFGRLIKAIRQCDEESPLKFAEKLNITEQQLVDIEQDRKSVTPELAALYAEILGYSPDQFIRLSTQD